MILPQSYAAIVTPLRMASACSSIRARTLTASPRRLTSPPLTLRSRFRAPKFCDASGVTCGFVLFSRYFRHSSRFSYRRQCLTAVFCSFSGPDNCEETTQGRHANFPGATPGASPSPCRFRTLPTNRQRRPSYGITAIWQSPVLRNAEDVSLPRSTAAMTGGVYYQRAGFAPVSFVVDDTLESSNVS